jgi:tetratricopeptide (TPR) repeat protein
MTVHNTVEQPLVESLSSGAQTKGGLSFWWLGVVLCILFLTWPNLARLTSDLCTLTARQLFATGHHSGALWLLTQAERIQADQPYAYAMASHILYDLGDISASQQQLETGLKTGEGDSALLNNLAVIKYEQYEMNAAIELAQQASAAALNVAIPHYNLGVISWQRGDSVAAGRAFREAARIDPNWMMPYFYLALIHMDLEEYPVADEYAQKMIALQPDQSIGYELRIQALLAQKEGATALAAIPEAEVHIANQERVRLYQALAMNASGERETAQIVLEKLFRWTNDPSLRRRVAIELRALDHP